MDFSKHISPPCFDVALMSSVGKTWTKRPTCRALTGIFRKLISVYKLRIHWSDVVLEEFSLQWAPRPALHRSTFMSWQQKGDFRISVLRWRWSLVILLIGVDFSSKNQLWTRVSPNRGSVWCSSQLYWCPKHTGRYVSSPMLLRQRSLLKLLLFVLYIYHTTDLTPIVFQQHVKILSKTSAAPYWSRPLLMNRRLQPKIPNGTAPGV